MTPEETQLYQRICQFEIDDSLAAFPFSAKLSWEYQWSGIYTYRVIQEYKKFLFLVMVANQEISPSTAVDRAWHLHLLYTQSYWDELCGKVLKRSLHHIPGLGRKEDGLKYYYQYCQTLDIYHKYFGMPPDNIWNPPKYKGEKISFQWVDREKYWIIPKPTFSRSYFHYLYKKEQQF
ncbi:MAG: hypothetical protein QNJ64_18875 [Crocosphaera sp.]|nr:hypothetical protein [Crocosphaera sp.]